MASMMTITPTQLDCFRPMLISRHSSCLPAANAKSTLCRVHRRRCRSASPPFKKRISRASECDPSAIDETAQEEPVAASKVSKAPIIKHLTSNYSVRYPKPVRSGGQTACAKARSQALLESTRNYCLTAVLDRKSLSNYDLESVVHSLADINGNNAKYVRCKDTAKLWNSSICHSKSHSQPINLSVEEYTHYNTSTHLSEPARKKILHDFSATKASANFSSLPNECKLRIFALLTERDKGACFLVCKEWNALVWSPDLWKSIDFRNFSLCYGHDDNRNNSNIIQSPSHDQECFSGTHYSLCTKACYVKYIRRIESFVSFIIDVKPRVLRLTFAFDLVLDNWAATMERFIVCVCFKSLVYANINWRDTPVRPFWFDKNQGLNDIAYRTRRRQRKFVSFMETFVHQAPNLMTLIMPFDWSSHSLNYLCTLKRLRYLTLEKYFILQALPQTAFDALSHLSSLERLVVEVWNPSSVGYTFRSETLKYLDISQCRNIHLAGLDLPSLEILITDRKFGHNQSVLQTHNNNSQSRCLQDVLARGTRKLRRINNVPLLSPNVNSPGCDLSDLFNRICSCIQHKNKQSAFNNS